MLGAPQTLTVMVGESTLQRPRLKTRTQYLLVVEGAMRRKESFYPGIGLVVTPVSPLYH